VLLAACAVVIVLAWWVRTGEHRSREGRDAPASETQRAAAAENVGPVESASPPEAGTAAVSVTVLDMETRAPIGGVTVRLTARAKDATATSDAAGTFEIEEKLLQDLDSLAFERADDLTIASSPGDVRTRHQIWCHRTGEVTGRVVFAEGGAPGFDAVTLEYAAPFEPGSAAWTRRNRALDALRHPDDDGRFRVVVPRVPRAAIVARAAGWAPGWADIDEALTPPARELVIVLRRAPRIRGVLRDQRGEPIANQAVQVYVVVTTTADDTEAIGRLKPSGFAVSRSVKDNRTVHRLSYAPRTDEDGRWSVDVATDGDVYAVVYRPGVSPATHDLGRAGAITREVELTAADATPERVRIEQDHRPLAHTDVWFTDISIPNVQHGFAAVTDADGVVETTFLVRGHLYVLIGVESPVYFQHTGATIVVEDCDTSFDDFLAKHGVRR